MKSTFIKIYLLSFALLISGKMAEAQKQSGYIAPQDTVKLKRNPNASLNTYTTSNITAATDSRMIGAAVIAAAKLKDTTAYNKAAGIPVNQLFKEDDLTEFSKGGFVNIVALFEAVNKNLPESSKLQFITTTNGTSSSISNPLELKDLRIKMAANPANAAGNRPQWQENIYQAYRARDYGTKLENTITITSATREMREDQQLALTTDAGREITLAQLLQQQNGKPGAETRAVVAFRGMTYPGQIVSPETAHENYRRALFSLIDLQQSDFEHHPQTASLLNAMTADLQSGVQSKIIAALKGSTYFDKNLPGNLGPVLLTEPDVINPGELSANAKSKALELFTLTALHYGERDASKLYFRLLNQQGALAAASTQDFTAKRLAQLSYHGTEKMKSAGLGAESRNNMTFADLVLVAVAAPASPATVTRQASLSLTEVGKAISERYETTIIQTTKSIFQLNPRISVGSRYTTYKANYDPIGYANNVGVTQKGVEFRLESDLYLGKLDKMLSTGLKPFIYPEFGVVFGTGKRAVGYDGGSVRGMTTLPSFKQDYINWGGHLGLNVGPVLVGVDASLLSTKAGTDANQRFFDLSKAMTYYRYSFLTRILSWDLGKASTQRLYTLTLDAELAGETNNERTSNRTRTQNSSSQVKSGDWQTLYDRAHPNGKYNSTIANQMLADGTVKASYPSANYAAAHIGIVRGGLAFKVTGGLYNKMAITGYNSGKGEWVSQLFKNTLKGNGFAAATLTYNFGTSGMSKTTRTVSKKSSINGVDSESSTADAPKTERIQSGVKSRALIMINK
ncbi:hypothetical protein ACXZ1K_05565 [Pedobacter sp. PWIIR3]